MIVTMDASDRILVLSAIILAIIIIYSPSSGLMRTIVTVDDVEIEIATLRDNYTLGEGFTATVYLVNNRSEEVRMEPITGLTIEGRNVNDTGGIGTTINWTPAAGTITTLPAYTKMKLVDTYFTPEQTGEFTITCLGVQKTVQIFQPMKGEAVELWFIDDLLDPESALSHGFKGYVNVSYVSETPVRVIVSPGKVINYTIQLKLIPHVPEFTETEVALDPKHSSGYGAGWSNPPIFNAYIRYSPSGTLILKADEPLNVTMILSVPEGLRGMSAYPRHLLGVGIMADIPVAHGEGAHLDRINP